MKKIENGNTAIGVNQAILEYLIENIHLHPEKKKALDLPCGEGQFMLGLKRQFPNLEIKGKDLFAQPLSEAIPYFSKEGVDQWSSHRNEKFDLITCISGVMVFDSLASFFAECRSHLNVGGALIVTNDNIMTMRDRLSWLLWGRLRRFKKFYDIDEGNWNVVLVQALVRLFLKNGIEIQKIEYVSIRWEDWLLAPLALALYPLQILTLFKAPSEIPMGLRMQMYSWKSFFARHYIIYGKLKA